MQRRRRSLRLSAPPPIADRASDCEREFRRPSKGTPPFFRPSRARRQAPSPLRKAKRPNNLSGAHEQFACCLFSLRAGPERSRRWVGRKAGESRSVMEASRLSQIRQNLYCIDCVIDNSGIYYLDDDCLICNRGSMAVSACGEAMLPRADELRRGEVHDNHDQ